MALETEVKIRISQEELDPIRTRLTELGARCVSSRQEEENVLFDFPDRNLEAAGCAIRLRIYGEHTLLTFKGKIQDDPHYKKREELESSVSDAEKMKAILQALGMEACFKYSKFREIYRISLNQQRVEVCLDETPVGIFVEIEGSPPAIEDLAAHFGWTSDLFIRKNYVEMYLEKLTADH
ncbi:class IV adenylate cyclase [Acidobacteria bacterium AH-259-D05]|nr:class IV adenylate cyclase [Acidobacteria bacterium AH-259-D05]